MRRVLVQHALGHGLLQLGREGALQLGEDGVHVQLGGCPWLQWLAQLDPPAAGVAWLGIQHHRSRLQANLISITGLHATAAAAAAAAAAMPGTFISFHMKFILHAASSLGATLTTAGDLLKLHF